MLEPFGDEIWVSDGPPVPFFGIPYPTRMAVVRLQDGGLWIWSPIAMSEPLSAALTELGPVSYLISPNKLHHLSLQDWKERWPEARLYASPGLRRKRKDLAFEAELDDQAPTEWADEIDQLVLRGSFALEELVFFHRRSSTALVCDLIQRFDAATLSGWRRLIMRLDGMVGADGSTPREWRATFLARRRARAKLRQALEWNAERLIIAHGACARSDGAGTMRRCLAWLRP